MSQEIILNELRNRYDTFDPQQKIAFDELQRRLTPQQEVQFSRPEIELWKRDNLTPKKAKRMTDETALRFMKSDFAESGLDRDSYLLGLEKEDISPIEQGIVGFGQGVRELGQEVGKLGLAAGEGIGFTSPEFRQEFAEGVTQQRKEFEESDIGQMPITQGFKVAGQVAPTVAIPGGVVGGIVRRLAVGGGTGALTGAIMPTDTADVLSSERMSNVITGAGFGATAGGVTKAIEKTPDFFNFFTKKGGKLEIQEPLSTLVSKADIQATDDAAKGLGVFLTPGERTNVNLIVAREKQIDLPKNAELNLQIKLLDREKSLEKSVTKLIQDIAPDDPLRAKAIKEGYEVVAKTNASPKFISKISEDPILGRQYKGFLKDADYQVGLDKFPENSMARLDEFQKYLSEQMGSLYKDGKMKAYRNVRDARKELMQALDNTMPAYALARREAHLNLIRENLEKGGKKLKAAKGALTDPQTGMKHPTAVQFYQKYLKSDEAFEEFMRNTDDLPGAALKATQLRVVLGAVEGTPISSVFSKPAPTTQLGSTAGQGTLGALGQRIAGAVRKNFYEGMVNYITDPNLSSSLLEEAADVASKRAKTVDDFDRIVNGFAVLASRIGTATVTQEEEE